MSENKSMTADQTGMATRVLRELLRTPAFKELVKIRITETAPGTAQELAKIFLWEDVDFSLSLLGSSPNAINFVGQLAEEVGRQLANFPSHILKDFLSQMGEKIDKDTFKALPQAYAPLVEELFWEDLEVQRATREKAIDTLNALLRNSATALERLERGRKEAPSRGKILDIDALARLINASSAWIGDALSQRPNLLRELVERLDGKVMRGAARALVQAALDFKVLLTLASWCAGALMEGIKGRLSRVKG